MPIMAMAITGSNKLTAENLPNGKFGSNANDYCRAKDYARFYSGFE
ncbi:MAG TPA: hypothetical protein VF884_12570 [Nitrososphaeraceae archaeon]